MGVVYRAHDEQLDRDVALKLLSPGVLPDETARKRLRSEAQALAKLNHPNIASVYVISVHTKIPQRWSVRLVVFLGETFSNSS